MLVKIELLVFLELVLSQNRGLKQWLVFGFCHNLQLL